MALLGTAVGITGAILPPVRLGCTAPRQGSDAKG
jgi:hypothetical protein